MLTAMEVTRDELERLIAEALLRDGTFRPKRRNWSETRSEDERRARIIAAAIVTMRRRITLSASFDADSVPCSVALARLR